MAFGTVMEISAWFVAALITAPCDIKISMAECTTFLVAGKEE